MLEPEEREDARQRTAGAIDSVIAAYLQALDRGEAPSRSAILARHPELRGELEEFFAAEEHAVGIAAELSRAAPSPLPGGTRLGDYELLGEIARGGMGVVYRARQVRLDRLVALKAVLGGRLASPAEIARFRREARAIAALDHARVVPIHDIGEADGCHFFTMKLMEGGSLADPRVPVDRNPRSAAALVEKVARTVHLAHAHGILHRDLKPANILLDEAGEPHVSDFGLAKPLADAGDLTRTGEILGTASYMAPEQASGREPITAAADIYGIGAILYQLITGHPPFKAPSSVETLRWVVEEEPRRPRDLNGLVPLDLESVCLKCLEKEPRRRYASAEALAEDLRRFLAREPVAARPVGRIERSWRWCRRHPAPAAIGLLLGVLAIGASLSAWGLSRARDHAFQSLRAARLAEAKALALSGKPGQRRGALAAVREAARHGRDLELRNAAVAALASTDLEVAREWQGCPPGTESVAFDGDLRRYARGDRTGGISVRDVDGDRELVRLEGPAKKALVIGFGPDDRLLAARYGDSQGANDLWVWDWAAGKRLFAPSPGAFQFAADLRASPPAVAAADPGGVLRVFALPSGELVSELSLGGMSHLVRFNPRGSQLAASTGRSLLVYDAESGRSEANLAHHDQVSSITWHPDGEQLASAAGNAVYLWKWRAPREPLRTFRAAESAGLNVTFSHAGDLLASSSFDGGLKLIGAGGSRLLSDESARSWPQWSRDDRLLGYFRNEGQLGFWQVTRNEVCRTLPVPGRYLGAPAFAGGLLWCPSRAGVHCWDLERGRELALLPLTGVGDVVRAGEDAILTASSQGLLSWPLAPGVEAERRLLRIGPPRRLALAPGDRLQDADLSSDGRYLGLVHEEPANHVLLLDLARDGAVIRTLEHYNVVWIAVARDAAWVAGGALYGHDFKVWRGQTGEEAWRFPAPVDNLTARPAFTPDGRKLLLSTDSGFSLYETGSWRLLHTFARKEFTEHPGAPAIAPDGRTAALAMGRLIAIADLESGAELATLASPEPSLISNLGFSPGGGWLVAATRQDSVHVWRLAALRRGLADLGLDWDLPAAAAEGGAAALPVVVEVDSGAPTGER